MSEQQQYWLWFDKYGNPVQTKKLVQTGGPLFNSKAEAQYGRAKQGSRIRRVLLIPDDEVGVTRDPSLPGARQRTANDLRNAGA